MPMLQSPFTLLHSFIVALVDKERLSSGRQALIIPKSKSTQG